jgi:hypothetical protein
MSKKKSICRFCKKPVDLNEEYFCIMGPEGEWIDVHEHEGVEKHGGIRMKKGHPVREE